jgi:suppressor of ftsI
MKNGHFPNLLMSRRQFLGLGAGALAAVGLGSSAHSTPFGSYFYEPEVRSSANGFLSTRLRASAVPTVIDGQAVISSVYEGTFPGPTLKIRPGDFLRIELINDLSEETNLHVHGLHVSPLTPGDNVLLHIPPGERFVYEYTLPKNHPAGTYFYHPHRHGLASSQTFKGMSGMIIIEGDIDQIPGIAGLPERSLVLQRPAITGGFVPDVHPNLGLPPTPRPIEILVNGALKPIMFISPGETQRWRLLNATIASLWTIGVEGHDLTLISQDGNTLANAVTMSSVNIATAQRRDVLIQGGPPGVYAVTYQDLQGPFITPTPPEPIAYLVSTGPAIAPQPLPTTLLPFLDLRTVPVDTQRSITFEINGDPTSTTFAGQGFNIDGKPFDENRIDQFVNLGATEEWTVSNATGIIHPFHIHINPYQVIKINGQPYDALSYEDTTPVPAKSDSQNGSITFRTRFLDFTGTFVFHCHILGHEDGGMMATVQVS